MLQMDYNSFNKIGHRSLLDAFINVLIISLRSTFANLIFLLIALGFGTVTNKLGKYVEKISVITFLFFIASIVNHMSHYLNQVKKMKLSVRLAAKAPFVLFQAMFVFWTIAGLARTISYLKTKGDDLKYGIMKCFGFWILLYFSVLIFVAAAFLITHVFIDAEWVWKTAFIFEMIWFSTFTITLFAIAIIFRPNDDS